MSALNRTIGLNASFFGTVMLTTGISWLIARLLKDWVRAVLSNIPLPESSTDFAILATLILWGLFSLAWGKAMLQEREWGALMGGLVHLMWVVFLAALGLFLFQLARNPDFTSFIGEGRMSFYYRWFWLIWGGYVLILLWFGSTAYWLLLGRGRRALYAKSHETNPAPAHPTCPRCGLLLNPEGKCVDCDRRRQIAYVQIGPRVEMLEFVDEEAGTVKIIGRKGGRGNPDVVILPEEAANLNAISGRHVAIEYHFDDEQFSVQDIHSQNGTRLNDSALPPNDFRRLRHGDVLSLAGQVDVTFTAEGHQNGEGEAGSMEEASIR